MSDSRCGGTRPLISIGMPVRNGARCIKEALDSLLRQTLTDFELIISDNASQDATRAICEDYAASYSQIQYHRLDVNVGAARNYNRVFQLSTGRYFKWGAHDDVCLPTAVIDYFVNAAAPIVPEDATP